MTHYLGQLAQQGVASGVAGAVVYRLKAIEIDKRQHVLLLCGGKQQPLQLMLKAGAVRQARQHIVRGAVVQTLQHFARFADVLNHQHAADIFSRQGFQRRQTVVNSELLAGSVMQDQIAVQFGDGRILRQVAAQDIFHFRAVGAVRDAQYIADGLAFRLFLRPAAHLLRHRIHKGDAQFFVGADHRFTNRIKRNMHALFFLIERFGQHAQLGDILIDAQHAGDVAFRTEQAVSLRANIANAVAGKDTALQGKRLSLFQRAPHRFLRHRTVVGMQAPQPEFIRWAIGKLQFINGEHALIPAHFIRGDVPFPDADAARLVSQRDALHQPLVFRLALFQAADVLNLRNKVEWVALQIAHQRNGLQHPNDLAILTDIAFFQRVIVLFATQQAFRLLQIGGQIVRPGDLLPAQLLQRVRLIAKQTAKRLVHLQPVAVRRHQRHADGRVLHRVAKALFAFADMLFLFAERKHHHRHDMARNQHQQKRQPGRGKPEGGIDGMQLDQIERQQQRRQRNISEKNKEGFQARQAHRRPEQNDDNEGKRPG